MIIKNRSLPLLLLLLSIVALSGCVNIDSYTYIGDKPLITITESYSVIQLDINNNVGSITLESGSSLTSTIVIENKISARSGYVLADAKNVTTAEINQSTVKISFISDISTLGTPPYQYDIKVTVPPNMALEIKLSTSTGLIEVRLGDSKISSLDLSSSTGGITVTVHDSLITDSSPVIDLSTGDIDVSIGNNYFDQNITDWSITASTGKIRFNLNQNSNFIPAWVNLVADFTHIFNVGTSTGSIYVETFSFQDFGMSVTAGTTTGTVTLPNGGETYTTNNYDTASGKFIFNLDTSTGSIRFTHEFTN